MVESPLVFIRQVESVFHQYWGGHVEVVTTFFSQPRPREQLLTWLDLQLYKEIHVVPEHLHALVEMYDKIDAEVDRGEYEAEAYELADETQHYRLLADIRELITGEKLKATTWKPSPEQQKLEGVRLKYANRGPLVKSIGGFSPGGGVAFAAAGAAIGGGPVERLLARTFKIIYRQELAHYHKNRMNFERLVWESDHAHYGDAALYAKELARQHFILRNASFTWPLSPQRVAEIDAGEVTSYVPPRFYGA